MKLAFRIDFYDKLEEYAKVLSEHGYNHVEISAPYSDDFIYQDYIKQIADKYRLGICVHANYGDHANISSYNREIREIAINTIKKDIQFASSVQSSILVVHPGRMDNCPVFPLHHPYYKRIKSNNRFFKDQAIKYTIHSLEILTQYARKYGVSIALENMCIPCQIIKAIEDMRWLLDDYSDVEQLGITLDIGHALAAGVDLDTFLNVFNSKIFHVHAHWNDRKYDLHLPIYNSSTVYNGQDYSEQKHLFNRLVSEFPDVCITFEMVNADIDCYIRNADFLTKMIKL